VSVCSCMDADNGLGFEILNLLRIPFILVSGSNVLGPMWVLMWVYKGSVTDDWNQSFHYMLTNVG
jgi:hypothetical protein